MSTHNLLVVADQGADATTKRLFHEISQLGEHFPGDVQEQEVWRTSMEDLLKFCIREEEGFVKGQLVVIHYLERSWPEFPEEYRKSFKNDFWSYAEIRTGKDRGTLQNYLRAVRTFIVDAVGPKHTLKLPERDPKKQPIRNEDGSISTKDTPWNPVAVPISKLIAITARAKAGTMTDKLWTMAQDDGVTWEQLQLELSSSNGGGSGGSDPTMKFILEGEILFVTEGSEERLIGTLQGWGKYYGDPDSLEARALKRILAVLNVTTDEEALHKADLRNRNKDVYPDST